MTIPRNRYALSAKTRKTKTRKHKNTPKGGAKNEQAELLEENTWVCGCGCVNSDEDLTCPYCDGCPYCEC